MFGVCVLLPHPLLVSCMSSLLRLVILQGQIWKNMSHIVEPPKIGPPA